jgi:hypothetical protein
MSERDFKKFTAAGKIRRTIEVNVVRLVTLRRMDHQKQGRGAMILYVRAAVISSESQSIANVP